MDVHSIQPQATVTPNKVHNIHFYHAAAAAAPGAGAGVARKNLFRHCPTS